MARRVYHRKYYSPANKSSATWKSMTDSEGHENQPRICATCGIKLRMTKDRIWMRRFPVLESFCQACTPKWRLVRAAQVIEVEA